MAIQCLSGLMGSGKTYESISEIIVPACIAGRRIVACIDGIQPDRIREFASKKSGKPVEQMGHVVACDFEDPKNPFFYPTERISNGQTIITPGEHVQPGDLVVIDEAWRYYARGVAISPNALEFFRMHRHFVGENGLSCDVVLITQTIGDLDNKIKSVIQTSTRTSKLVRLGLSSRYRVDIYDGPKQSRNTLVSSRQKKYNPEIFPLYQSYAGGKGKEVAIDNRGVIWKDPKFVFLGVLVIGFFAWGIPTLKSTFFDRAGSKSAQPESFSSLPPVPASQQKKQEEKKETPKEVVLGVVKVGGIDHALIRIDDQLRLINTNFCIGQKPVLVCEYENKVFKGFGI